MRDDSYISRLRGQAVFLSTILREGDPAALTARPQSTAWSCVEIVAHLGRYNELLVERLHRIATEASPRLARYRAEEDPRWAEWSGLSIDEAIRGYRRSRSLLMKSVRTLTPAQRRRYGIHPLLGRLTVDQWLNFFLVHEGHHIYRLLLQMHIRPDG